MMDAKFSSLPLSKSMLPNLGDFGALTGEAGIADKYYGKIELYDRQSNVALHLTRALLTKHTPI